MLLGLDPGPTHSAVVCYEPQQGIGLCEFHYLDNAAMRAFLREYPAVPGDVLVIEQIAAMGMAVGGEVFETCVWSGRFWECWPQRVERLKRVPIKMHLCGTSSAKDANVRRALMDRFGGDASVKKGGALYRVSGDCWAALAVAVTYADTATSCG